MRQELQNLRLRNAELEGNTNSSGTKKKQHSDLRSSEALTAQVEAMLSQLGETSSGDSDVEDT